MRIKTVAVVPSAGYGKRLGLKKKKPFVSLKGKPLVSYALSALNSCGAIDGIIIACEELCVGSFKALVRKFKLHKVIDIVIGGSTRFESVRNCLERVDESFDIVLIHDGARPFIDHPLIEGSIRLAARYGGAIVAVPEYDTVKLVDKNLFIKNTLDRRYVFRAQTPQAFRRELIKSAYKTRARKIITDDSALAEELDARIKILKGSCKNMKITTREDLKLAEVFLCESA